MEQGKKRNKDEAMLRTLRSEIQKHFTASIDTKVRTMKACMEDIVSAAGMMALSLARGNKIMLCGNGGSAADSQHIAGELIVRLRGERNRKALPAVALTTDTSILTACANDYGFDMIFSRQVEGLGRKGDVLIAITTSGNSANVINAIHAARKRGIKVIGLLGGSGGNARALCNISIIIPAEITHFIQESHITVGHILCSLTETMLFGPLKHAKTRAGVARQ